MVFNVILMALQKTKLMLAVNVLAGSASIAIYKIFIMHWDFYGAIYARIVVSIIFILSQLFFIKFRNHPFIKLLKLN